jgi:glycosyltransferase involved in cell wall biosynthesis
MPHDLRGKKVCFVSPAAYPLFDRARCDTLAGGAEAQLFTIGRELAKVGMDVHFIVGDHGQPGQVVRDGVTAHRGSFRYMGGSKKALPKDWLRFISLIRSIHADYYLIKVPHHLLFVLGMSSRLFGGKVIYIGQKDSDFDEKLLRRQEGRIGWWLYRTGMRMATAVAAQTKTQQNGFLDVFGKESTVIRNVLTLEDEEDCIKDDYILWVGNSTEDKQPHIVLELARRLPELRFRMIMGISPSRSDDGFIRRHLAELPNLEYLGEVPFAEISKHYKSARVFISTSRCEGFPNTFLQAWQYKTPVVSLLVDPDGVIMSNRLGRLSGSVEKMIEDIDELLQNRSLCSELGGCSRNYAYENHSLDSAVQGYCKLFSELE